MFVLIGIAGVPDDLRQWREWVDMLTDEGINWLLVSFGAAGLIVSCYFKAIVRVFGNLWEKSLALWKKWRSLTQVRRSPGAGRLVARAIMEADSLDEAQGIFDEHHAAPNPKDTDRAAYALVKRMEDAGKDATPFIFWLVNEGIDITKRLEEIEDDPIFQGRP